MPGISRILKGKTSQLLKLFLYRQLHLIIFWKLTKSYLGPGRQQRTTRSLYCPSPRLGGEEIQKKKAKLVGLDKDSLTEQQRKRTVATTILTERIHKTKGIHSTALSPPDAQCSQATIHFPPGRTPVSTEHDGTCYRIPSLFGRFVSASPAMSPPDFLWKLTLSQPNPGH